MGHCALVCNPMRQVPYLQEYNDCISTSVLMVYLECFLRFVEVVVLRRLWHSAHSRSFSPTSIFLKRSRMFVFSRGESGVWEGTSWVLGVYLVCLTWETRAGPSTLL